MRQAVDPDVLQRRLRTASLLNLAGQVLAVVLMLASTPRLIRGLGNDSYGLLALISSFTSYFAYLEMGIGSAYIRELTIAFSRQEQDRAQRLYETAHYLYCRVAWFGAAGMLALGIPYTYLSLDTDALHREALGAIVTASLTFLCTMMLSTSRGVVFAAQRADVYSLVSLVLQPFVPLMQVVLVWMGGRVASVLMVFGAASVLMDVLMLMLARREHPELILRREWHADIWRELRGFSLQKFIGQLTMQGQAVGDRMLLGSLRSTAELTPYAVGSSIGQRLRILGTVVAFPLSPALIDAFARLGLPGIASPLITYVRRVVGVGALASAVGSFLAYPFLSLWVGGEVAIAGTPILNLSLISSLVLTISTLLTLALDAANRPEVGARSSVVMLVLSVVFSLPLLAWLGPVGVGWGFLLGSLVQLGWMWLALGTLLGAGVARALVVEGLVRPVLLFAVAYGAMRLGAQVNPLQAMPLASFWKLLPVAAFGGLVGAAVAYATGTHRTWEASLPGGDLTEGHALTGLAPGPDRREAPEAADVLLAGLPGARAVRRRPRASLFSTRAILRRARAALARASAVLADVGATAAPCTVRVGIRARAARARVARVRARRRGAEGGEHARRLGVEAPEHLVAGRPGEWWARAVGWRAVVRASSQEQPEEERSDLTDERTEEHERQPVVVIRPESPLSLADLRELWAFRRLLAVLAWRDVSVRYKQAVLGLLWAVVQPLTQVVIFTVLFERMAGLRPAGERPFLPFVLVGISFWGFFSTAMTQASDSLMNNSNLVSKVYFPRLILPLSALAVAGIDLLIALGLLLGVSWHAGLSPGVRALWLLPMVALVALVAVGLGMFLAAVKVRYRDVRHALPFLTQVAMYLTPVFYATAWVPERWRPLFELNPLAAPIEGARAALFGDPLPVGSLGVSLAISLATVVLGYIYFKRYERTLSDQL